MKKIILPLAALAAALTLQSCTTTLTTVYHVDEDGFVTGVERNGVYTPVAPVPDQQTAPSSDYRGPIKQATYYFK